MIEIIGFNGPHLHQLKTMMIFVLRSTEDQKCRRERFNAFVLPKKMETISSKPPQYLLVLLTLPALNRSRSRSRSLPFWRRMMDFPVILKCCLAPNSGPWLATEDWVEEAFSDERS